MPENGWPQTQRKMPFASKLYTGLLCDMPDCTHVFLVPRLAKGLRKSVRRVYLARTKAVAHRMRGETKA
jgi:hypothetical protein